MSERRKHRKDRRRAGRRRLLRGRGDRQSGKRQINAVVGKAALAAALTLGTARHGGTELKSRRNASDIIEATRLPPSPELPLIDLGDPTPLIPAARPRPSLSRNTAYDAHINEAARKHGVDADLVRAIIQVESGFNPRADSRKGAKGLMQLMPTTARDMGARNALDPKQNIFAGARYLRFLLDSFDGDLTLATAAYNAGPTVVKRHGGVPPFEETRNYVDRVQSLLGLEPPTLEPPPALMDALFTPEDLGPALASAEPRPFRSKLRALLRRGMGVGHVPSGRDSDQNG
jgi:hypothetical protein